MLSLKSFKRHVSVLEKTALIVIWLLMAVSVAAQLFYGGGAMTLLLCLSVCAVLLSYLILTPARYEFEDDALVLVNFKPMRNKKIPYADMICYDTVGSFLALKVDFDSTEVMITYKSDKSVFKKTVSCHPKNIQDFVKALQQRCPNLIDV